METTIIDQYLSEMAQYKRVNDAEMVRLANRLRDGDESAFEIMVNSNLRLAIAIAQDYVRPGFTLSECVSYANEGLINAVRKWDSSKHSIFSAYARKCIRSKLRDGTRTERLMPISDYSWKRLTKLKKVQSKLETMLERNPTYAELSDYLNGDMTEQEIRSVLFETEHCLSYDISLEETYTDNEYLGAY